MVETKSKQRHAAQQKGQRLKSVQQTPSDRIIQTQTQTNTYTHTQDLQKQVKQARDLLLLYHLEESDDSEDERRMDAYLANSITNYIENKSVRDLVNEGRLEPQPFYQ